MERFGADSPKKLVSFEISNLSHFYPHETSIKTTSYTCKVLDEMSKIDLDVDSLYSGTTERNNKTEAFGDLFFDAFFIDNESDVEAFEIMHLGWIFVNDESDIDTKSVDGDGKEVLSWQARFDLIVFKIMTFYNLWFDFENDMKTWAKIWPWEEIEKSLVLLTEGKEQKRGF